ncbi:sialidase family protein [Umezawaea tangerina]|uniref:Putative neuraminidase n=1 Tax=Umezawaea tangerina TaxID=84725 RepID=A0A2T0THE1_9PSEU|nr:exo-alpha-sialidase [Umezawaea tangerina]PRY45053.1 putative neuraminidase [Umezawaea tangerina]
MSVSTAFDGVLRTRADDPERRDAMLPATAVQNHAANLATLPGGDLGCVWFGGTQEGVPDISVWFSRLPVGGDTWSAPVRLSDDGTRSEQNPVLFPVPGGGVWLLWTAQVAGNQDTAEVRRRTSADGGRTWGPTTTLFPATPTGGVFVRQPVVVLGSGRWLLPVFHCVSVPGRKWVGDRDTSAVLVSDDAGETWFEVAVPESTGLVHMNVVPLPDGTLAAFYRSRFADFVHRSTSTDDGATWTPPRPVPDLPNNNSSIQVVRLADDRLAAVFNDSSARDATERRLSLYDEIDDDGLADRAAPTEEFGTAFWGAPRAPMTLALSSDGGVTWPVRRNLEVGDGYCLTNNSRDGLNRELSYPAVHQAADGSLDIAFTYFRQTIEHVRVPVSWVR